VAVEEEEPFDALPLERVDEVGDELEECGRSHGEGETAGYFKVVRIDAEGHGGEEEDFGAFIISVLYSAAADGFDLINVGRVGHMEIVGLGGAEGQDGDFPLLRPDECMGLLGEDEFIAHGFA
jgi:hypothetical protein